MISGNAALAPSVSLLGPLHQRVLGGELRRQVRVPRCDQDRCLAETHQVGRGDPVELVLVDWWTGGQHMDKHGRVTLWWYLRRVGEVITSKWMAWP